MKTITMCSYVCGMTEKTFSDRIMIYAPVGKLEKTYDYEETSNWTVADFVNCIKDDFSSFLGDYGLMNLTYERMYIYTSDAMIGMQENKKLAELFTFFASDDIRFCYFLVGGASIHYMGYKFVVHPNEDIHKNSPHVHVCKDDHSVRYSLETLERYKQDKVPHSFISDEKKIIIPYLKMNREKLLRFWNLYMNGFVPPVEDEKGRQYYAES